MQFSQPQPSVYHIILHLRVVDDKVIVEEHNTNADLLADLAEAGIPRESMQIHSPARSS